MCLHRELIFFELFLAWYRRVNNTAFLQGRVFRTYLLKVTWVLCYLWPHECSYTEKWSVQLADLVANLELTLCMEKQRFQYPVVSQETAKVLLPQSGGGKYFKHCMQ